MTIGTMFWGTVSGGLLLVIWLLIQLKGFRGSDSISLCSFLFGVRFNGIRWVRTLVGILLRARFSI